MKNVIKAKDVQSTARAGVRDARRTAQSALGDARKTARRQYVRGRVAVARANGARRTRTDKKKVAAAGAAGAAGAYFLDPQGGPRRRYAVRDKVLSLAEGLKSKARRENGAPDDPARTTQAEVSTQ